MIYIDCSRMSPLERSAVEYMAGLEVVTEGDQPKTVEEYVTAFLFRSMMQWQESLVDGRLPALRPLAKELLDLTPEQQQEAKDYMRSLRGDRPATVLHGDE